MEEKLNKLISKLEQIPAKNWKSVHNGVENQYTTIIDKFSICIVSNDCISVKSTRGYHIKSFIGENYEKEITKLKSKVGYNYSEYTQQETKRKNEEIKQEKIRISKENEEDIKRFELFLNQ